MGSLCSEMGKRCFPICAMSGKFVSSPLDVGRFGFVGGTPHMGVVRGCDDVIN